MKKRIKKLMSLLLAVIMIVGMCSLSFTAFAAGSAQLNVNDDGYRFYTEHFDMETSGMIRTAYIKCYLFAGETAYFGSSMFYSLMDINGKKTDAPTGVDILVTKPDGTKMSFDVIQDGKGYIGTTAQEKNGPKLTAEDADNDDKYQPLSYTADTEGIYTFEFNTESGQTKGYKDSTAQKVSVSDPVNNQQNISVAYWNITVVDSSQNIKTGRVWATHLPLNAGNATPTTRANLNVFVVTNDGFIYKVKFKDIVPYGFIFFANNQGFTTTGQTPYSIYHSFYDNDNTLNKIETDEKVTLHKPYMADTETAQSYKIFFEYPSSDLEGIVYNKLPEQISNISNLTFHGQTGGMSHYDQGGYFSFESHGATTASITIDFRDIITDLKKEAEESGELWEYSGSGIVEMRGAVKEGQNSFYWDGLDTVRQPIPIGLYGKDKMHIYTEVKGGEVHFPFVDVEGLYGGVEIERMNGTFLNDDDKYDIYYNNNPLKYNTIEGEGDPDIEYIAEIGPNGSNQPYYAILSDGTRSWSENDGTTTPTVIGSSYFNIVDKTTINQKNISTLVKDTPEYAYNLKYGEGEWDKLTPEEKEEFEEEFETFTAKYHHEPNDSRTDTILFKNNGANGGGNQAGIDIWTYYSTGIRSDVQMKNDMIILDESSTGQISGRIFYDQNGDKKYNYSETDYTLEKVEVELVDENGEPAYTFVPEVDEHGKYIRDEDGKIIYTDEKIFFKTTTDINGVYTFTGVPIPDEGKTYYVHTLLSPMQLDIQGYKLTTTTNDSVTKKSGPDGNKRKSNGMSETDSDGNTVFLTDNAQAATLTLDSSTVVCNDIGYRSIFDVKDYRVTKVWADDGTEKLTELKVKLYTCDADTAISRTGTYLDETLLSDSNSWSYTWKNLDVNRQYYMEEYYIKPDGTEVLLGGTMPVYSTVQESDDKYNFTLAEEDEARVKEYYGDVVSHNDAVSYAEKVAADPNATIYKVKYTLSKDATGKTNIITFTNSLSPYEDKEYYVWYGKESVLPNFVSKTEYPEGTKTSVPQALSAGAGTSINGMTITSFDADVNTDGNATNDFLYNSADTKSVKFTATDDIFTEGEGTRKYIVKYDDPTDDSDIAYAYTVTIHVYNVNQDYYVLDYGLKAKLQAENAKNGVTENYKYMVLSNDTIRVDLYKSASHPIMNSCTDFAGICYSPNGLVSDVSTLDWKDTKDNSSIELASENGKLSVNLSKSRTAALDKGDDHSNYAQIVFTPTTFMSDIDVFYYKIVVYGESVRDGSIDYNDINATNGVIMYAPIIVLPASTVYYEDGYRFSTQYSSNDFDVDNPDIADTTFQSISTDEHYGYDKAYLDPSGTVAGEYDSLGSTTNVEAKSSNFTFEFKGTGFDILGRTDSTAAKLTYRIDKKDASGVYKLNKSGTVDASYIDTNDGILRQLPVISIKDLAYGEYKVRISLTITSTGSYHFNLDGIRTYDPLGTAGSEYYIDSERQATVKSVRSMVLGTFDPELITDGYEPIDATAAIICSANEDGLYYPGSTVTEIRRSSSVVNHSNDLDDYLTVGPKCELYIPSGSGIAFNAVSDGSADDNTLQIEVKAINDSEVTSGGYGRLRNVKADHAIPVNSSTSMYYTLDTSFIEDSGIVILVNDSDYTVSVTNLKYKGYTIGYPENFVKPDEGAGTSVPSENWTDGKEVISEGVIVTSANFATSYTRAGQYVDINVTVVEKNGGNSAFAPVLFDESGNAVTLSENDITPVRSFKTKLDGEDSKGFVYRIHLNVPDDATALKYTVGAIRRAQVSSKDVYSANGWDIAITVKPADIALTAVKVSSVSSNMMRVTLISDEPITANDAGWTQLTTNSICSYFEEEGDYTVMLQDIDGYESQATFSVKAPAFDDEKLTAAQNFFAKIFRAILDFFLHIFGF